MAVLLTTQSIRARSAAVLLAPRLREDVVDVDGVVGVGVDVDGAARPEVSTAPLHLHRIEALVGGTVAATQGDESRGLELRLLNGPWFGVAAAHPIDDVRDVECEARLGGSAVHLAEDPAPQPTA